MKLSNLFTLIIPTYNRPRYLERVLKYYSYSDIILNIIVADSSNETIKSINKGIIENYRKNHVNLKIKYYEYKPNIISYHKFGEAVDKVRTKYTVFCADDDFITIDGIKLAIQFLEENKDYVAAHGDYILFNKKRRLFWVPLYEKNHSEYNNNLKRAISHIKYYKKPTFYALTRTNVLKWAFHQNKIYIKDFMLMEIFLSLIIMAKGKIKELNILYAMREENQVDNNHKKYMDMVNKNNYQEIYSEFGEGIMANLNSCNHKDTEALVQRALKCRRILITKSYKFMFSDILRRAELYFFLSDLYFMLFNKDQIRNITALKNFEKELKLLRKLIN